MVSGSDMHGTPITVTAQQEGRTPEEVAMHYHEINSKSIEDMKISFDLLRPVFPRNPMIPQPSNSYLTDMLRVPVHTVNTNQPVAISATTAVRPWIPMN